MHILLYPLYVMLLFEHKQHLQSYIAQSLKQTEIFSSTEIAFKDYNK